MLVALLNDNRIIATDPAWDDKKDEYRNLCNNQALCPICKEHIICKFGQINQHHFAHRRNTDCPGSFDTVEHMQGKAILYEFLNARYGDRAKIEIEPYFEEINQTGDVLLEFKNNSRWAIEFVCGLKQKEIQDKIDFYDNNDIIVTWIINSKLCEAVGDKQVRIARREQTFIVKTGIDIFYPDDWYLQIVVKKHRRSLPSHGDSLGTLMLLDIENKALIIFRAINPSNHRNVFEYGALLRGPLEEIIIRGDSKWGILIYFKQEEELGPKFREARKIRGELEAEYLAAAKARTEYEAKCKQEQRVREKFAKKKENSSPRYSSGSDRLEQKDRRQLSQVDLPHVTFGKSKNNDGWGRDEETFPKKYRCIYCQQEFTFGDMVHIPHFNVPEGTCRQCSKKRDLTGP